MVDCSVTPRSLLLLGLAGACHSPAPASTSPVPVVAPAPTAAPETPQPIAVVDGHVFETPVALIGEDEWARGCFIGRDVVAVVSVGDEHRWSTWAPPYGRASDHGPMPNRASHVACAGTRAIVIANDTTFMVAPGVERDRSEGTVRVERVDHDGNRKVVFDETVERVDPWTPAPLLLHDLAVAPDGSGYAYAVSRGHVSENPTRAVVRDADSDEVVGETEGTVLGWDGEGLVVLRADGSLSRWSDGWQPTSERGARPPALWAMHVDDDTMVLSGGAARTRYTTSAMSPRPSLGDRVIPVGAHELIWGDWLVRADRGAAKRLFDGDRRFAVVDAQPDLVLAHEVVVDEERRYEGLFVARR